MSQYVGKLISIVNNEHVRYVGILANISAETSSLVLNNVKVYGTEGRVSEGDNLPVVPKEDGKKPSAVFKGSDVRDLQVLEFDPLDTDNSTAQPAEKRGFSQDKHSQKHDIGDVNDVDDEDFATRTQKLSEGDRKEKVEPVYNKSNSFFDNLGGEEQSRPRRRVTNTQTFGAHNRDNYRRGGYRGGNRDNTGREHRDFNNREHWDSRDREYRDTRDTRDNRYREHRDSDHNGDGNSGYHNSLLGKDARSDIPRRGGSSSRGRGNRKPLDESKKSNQSHNEFIPGGQFA